MDVKQVVSPVLRAILCGAALTFLLPGPVARAADTVEPLEVGVSDFEFFAGSEGLGLKRDDVAIFSESLVGVGVTDRLSGYLAAGGQANGHFEEGGGTVSFGLYGAVIESEHFDLDLVATGRFIPTTSCCCR